MSTGRALPLRDEDCSPADLPTKLERMTEALTAPEVAELLGMGRTVVYQMASEGRIPHFRIGTMIRFDPVRVAGWLREREIGLPVGTRGIPLVNEPRDERQQKGRKAA